MQVFGMYLPRPLSFHQLTARYLPSTDTVRHIRVQKNVYRCCLLRGRYLIPNIHNAQAERKFDQQDVRSRESKIVRTWRKPKAQTGARGVKLARVMSISI